MVRITMKKGFSLVELLVVITIISILSAVGIASYQGVQSQARDNIRKNDLTVLSQALEIYFQKNGQYVAGSGITCNSGDTDRFYREIAPFMAANNVPKDPQTQAGYCYISQNDGALYRLFAKLENCRDDPDTIPNLTNCQTAQYNYSKVSEDLFIAAAPEDIALVVPPSPPPSSSPSPSPPTLTPTPTPPSVAFKRVFVTSTLYTGNLGGLAGADQKCQERADTANLGGTWKAWLSADGTAASLRLNRATIPYKLVNGTTVVANNWTDLTDGTLTNPINMTESGGSPPVGTAGPRCNVQVATTWTNTKQSGDEDFINVSRSCGDWTIADSTAASTWGRVDAVYSSWTRWCYGGTCSLTAALYCFEQ